MASNQPSIHGDATQGQSNNQPLNALFPNSNAQGGLFSGQGQQSLFVNPSNSSQPSLYSNISQSKGPSFGLASSTNPSVPSLFGGSGGPSQQGIFGSNPFQGISK